MTHLMLSGCSIQPLTAGDLPDVYALIGGIYEEYGMTFVLDDEAEQHLGDPEQYFRATGGEFWVVRDDRDSHLIATVAVHFHAADERTAELKSLYVSRNIRRSGFGRALTMLAMRYARARGRSHFVLWSDTRLSAAHALYESLGFRRCGERRIVDSNNSREFGFEIDLAE